MNDNIIESVELKIKLDIKFKQLGGGWLEATCKYGRATAGKVIR